MKAQQAIIIRRIYGAILWMLFQLSLISCGLGTEVGNGVKPGGDDKESSGKKTSASADNDNLEQQDASEDNESAPTSTDDIESGANNDTISIFNYNILFNSCASPFEANYGESLNLKSANDNGGTVNILGDFANGSWTFKDATLNDSFLAKISSNGIDEDYIVKVLDEEGKEKSTDYTCSAVSGSANGTVYTYTATLSKNDVKSTLTWNVDKSGTTEELLSVVIKPDNKDSDVILLETDNN